MHFPVGKRSFQLITTLAIRLSAGATHYLLIVAALYVTGAGLYAGKSLREESVERSRVNRSPVFQLVFLSAGHLVFSISG